MSSQILTTLTFLTLSPQKCLQLSSVAGVQNLGPPLSVETTTVPVSQMRMATLPKYPHKAQFRAHDIIDGEFGEDPQCLEPTQ